MRIQAYSVFDTFSQGSRGREIRRVVDQKGHSFLNEDLWAAGDIAYQSLLTDGCALIKNSEVNEWINEQNTFLHETFYPDFLPFIESGQIELRPPGIQGFIDAWAEYDFAERTKLFITFIDNLMPTWLIENPQQGASSIAALALLWRIDSAVMAEFMDGRGFAECVMDIVWLRDHIKMPERIVKAIAHSNELTLKRQAQSGGVNRHQKGNEAKAFVLAEWARFRGEYDNNKSAFTRDYVRRLQNEFDVTITEKQMREVWLKDTPATSKPDGLPADGE